VSTRLGGFIRDGYWHGGLRILVAPVVCAVLGHRLRPTVKGYWTVGYLRHLNPIRGHQCFRCWRGFTHADTKETLRGMP
jgi:hypothetical protein